MCGPTTGKKATTVETVGNAPIEKLLEPPSAIARYTCASIILAAFAVWGKLAFVPESEAPGVASQIHSFKVPLSLTVVYIVSLPILRTLSSKFLSKTVDVKLLLRESMFLYNAFQVLINGWMVYRFVEALVFKRHPLIGDTQNVTSGATYAVWVHYCDKYLEFLDTYFMVLRGRMDQVSFAKKILIFNQFMANIFKSRFLSYICIIMFRLPGLGGTDLDKCPEETVTLVRF